MSTREKVLQTINLLSEEQLEGLYAFLNGFYPEEITNVETLAAFQEAEDMKRHPENYTGFTDLTALFKELDA